MFPGDVVEVPFRIDVVQQVEKRIRVANACVVEAVVVGDDG